MLYIPSAKDIVGVVIKTKITKTIDEKYLLNDLSIFLFFIIYILNTTSMSIFDLNGS